MTTTLTESERETMLTLTIPQYTPNPKVGPRYQPVNLEEVNTLLNEKGWFATTISHNKGKTKHLIRYRQEGNTLLDVAPEIIIINSHVGASSFKIMLGLFRFACANGLILGQAFGHDYRIRHVGNVMDKVTKAIEEIDGRFTTIMAIKKRLEETTYTYDDARYKAFMYNLGANLITTSASANAKRLQKDGFSSTNVVTPWITASRIEDTQTNIWVLMNKYQEQLIKYGLEFNYNGVTVKYRKPKAIEKVVAYNKATFDAALAVIKESAA